MCGIFGIAIKNRLHVPPKALHATIKDLFLFSESRGKEAAGLAVLREDSIGVLKSAMSASAMIRTKHYKDLLHTAIEESAQAAGKTSGKPFTLIGHSRLVTTGTQYTPQNNQPVIAGHAVGIHNGIIVNYEDLWDRYSCIQRQYQVDTEVILRLIRMFYKQSGSLIEATQNTFGQIEGTASIALLFEDFDELLLATNNGSLYRCPDAAGNVFLFTSERYILHRLVRQRHVKKFLGEPSHIRQIVPGQGCLVNTRTLRVEEFQLSRELQRTIPISPSSSSRNIVECQEAGESHKSPLTFAQKHVGLSDSGSMDTQISAYLDRIRRRFPYDTSWQDALRRCTRCILPETMPFIEFDGDGVCNYCHNYRKLEFKPAEQLAEIAKQYRKRSGEPDCVVGISGGRDSLYSLHYVKTVLQMNPVAYTYDWGMVTDLARRNISRICAKLGIEHILVSADITQKRKFIKQNISAWLKRPKLGMIPLFMAGDKQYFYYLQQVRKRIGAEIAVLGENMLERTDFKTGFANMPPYNKDTNHVYTLPLWSKIRLAGYYAKEYLRNPGYINASLLDSFFAYGCYYFMEQRYVNLYTYVPWVEDEIITTLIDEYDFELAKDTTTTWRIGDGTAAFYNYIYYNVAGFTENETFRSNQIREGLITREEALRRVREENKPRYESIYWYLNIIELEIDMENVFEIIHAIPKLSTGTAQERG